MPVDKHTPEMTEAERERALAAARELSREFDAAAQRADEEKRFAAELVPLYKESGLVTVAVPKKYGGQGADILTTALVGRELAKGDPASALAYNMHQAMVGIFRGTDALDEPARERLFTRMVEEKLLLCGPFSEMRAGLSGLADTVAVPDGRGGWRLSGRKNWATLIEGADLISLNATITDEDGRLPEDYKEHAQRETTFIIPADAPGVSIDYTWDTLGMRGSGTQTLVLDQVYAGPEAYAGNFRQGLIGEAEWAALLFSGVYLGLADRAYEEARRILSKKHLGATLGGNDTAVKDLGYVQHGLGRMHSEIAVAERVMEATAAMVIDGRHADKDALRRKTIWDLTKVTTTEAAIRVTDLALRLVGGQAFRRGHVLERLFRDSRAGYLHSFGTDQLYDTVGRLELNS